MSTNYYLHTPDGQEIHLGKTAAGWPFMFRGYPERGITNYTFWRALLEEGEIRTEAGVTLTIEELEDRVDSHRGLRWRVTPAGRDQVDDEYGNRFTLVEFC